MRKIIFFLLCLVSASAGAQTPKWTIHPNYDGIRLLGNGYYVVTNNGKYGMLDSNEKEVVPMAYDSIAPFMSHQALLFNNKKFVAYVSDRGVVKEVADENYEVIGTPVFTDGYLLVRNRMGYYFISAASGAALGPYADASPFCEGFARIKVPKNVKHFFDGPSFNYYLSAETGVTLELPLEEGADDDDVDFLSSSNNGKSIIIVKKRAYEYNFSKNTLTPLSTDGTDARKARVMANERPTNVQPTSDGNYTIQFKQGSMTFDQLMRLTSIQYEDRPEQKFEIPQIVFPEPPSRMKGVTFPDTKLLGLSFNKEIILPAQFERIPMLWGDEALVVKDGKYGVVTAEGNRKWHYTLNDNQDIAFEHKSVKTHIKVLCPPSMNPSLLSLRSEDNNCIINTETRKENVNVESSVLDYECTLLIPEDIGIEHTPSTLSVSLIYDGLKYMTDKIEYKNWYANNYTVSLDEPVLSGGTMTVNINVKNNYSNNQNFFKTVTVLASDSVIASINKLNEELYTAKFVNWKDDRVHFEVNVEEDGCPILAYAFSLNAKEGKNNKQEKEVEEVRSATPKVKKAVKKPKPATPQKTEKKKILIPN